MVVRFPSWTVDDAFIVARYADNAVAHGELAFNPGAGAADRVEGFTSVLAMLVALIARAVNLDPIAATKLVCTAAALVGPALVAWLARSMRASPIAGGAAALLFALYPEHAVHARSGLETELFVACSLGLLVAFARACGARGNPTAFVVMGLLTSLARPEGMALVGILGAALLRTTPRESRRRWLRAFALGIVTPLALLALARLAYYGALFPNTFYAKHGTWNDSHARDLGTLLDFCVVDLIAIAATSAALSRIVGGRWTRLPPRVVLTTACAVVVLLAHVVTYARSEPIMDYGFRFAWHGIPLVAVVIIASIDAIVRCSRRLFRRRLVGHAVLAAIVIVIGVSSIVRSAPAAERESIKATRQAASSGTLHAPTIEWILRNTPPDAVMAVYPDAGRMPFETGRRTIDFGKLNDRVLARASSDREIAEYFFERRPDLIVFQRRASGRLWDSGADAIVSDRRFETDYELAFRMGGGDDGGDGYEIYRRRTR